MNKIGKEAYEKCENEIVDDDKYFWINGRDFKIELDNKQFLVNVIQKKQKYRCELIHNTNFQGVCT